MIFVRDAIRYRVTTAVGVILLVLFGGLAAFRLPIQLIPTVDQPMISVTTFWPAASPAEVERQIVQEQEDQLKSLEGLERMDSTSAQGQGTINLTFQTGTDLQAALLQVANRLEQVPRYPEDARKPVIRAANTDSNAIAWFALQKRKDNPPPGAVPELYDFADDFIRPEFERVPGVAQANLLGGQPHEMHFIADPRKLAARGITIAQLAAAFQREGGDISGGDFNEGKNRFIVRTVADYASAEDVENIVVGMRDGVPVFARDVGFARLGFRKKSGMGAIAGEPGLAMNVAKAPGANTLEVIAGLKAAAERLNQNLLAPRGLQLIQFADESEYIVSAIDLVRQSLYWGGALAAVVLLLFLRSVSSTLVITLAMPISLIGTFLLMSWLGRTINVISLAGMAFAIGMVVDNAIVVLENIDRHRRMGKRAAEAAYDGTREVWGAVLASTLTTIAVFVPVLFIQEEAGQLFRDIAVAISGGVGLSLVVAMTVIPALASKLMSRRRRQHKESALDSIGGRFTSAVGAFVYWICHRVWRRTAIVAGFTTAAVGFAVMLAPKVEYLPAGNANFLFGLLILPPGYNFEETSRVGETYQRELKHLWETPAEDAQALPGGGVYTPFYVAFQGRAFLGGRARDPMRLKELIPEFQKATTLVPGAIGIFRQANLFQRGGPSGGDIEINIGGPDFVRLREIANILMGRIREAIPGAQAAPASSVDGGLPELQVIPDRRRMSEMGITARDLGFAVSSLIDGAKATDYQWEGKRIDLKILADDGFEHRTHLVEQLPIATPVGKVVPLGSVARVVLTDGPVEINHRERQRAVTVRVAPPADRPLQAVMEDLETKVIQPMQRDGTVTGLYRMMLSGSVDKLTQAWEALRFNFLLAILITYLLMAALFQSFLHPFVILFSVPLAALGGFLGLWAINQVSYQALDLLTMLGFFILVGTVVNNAILIVHQSLNHMREDHMAPREAIREATQNRIRPIFMSVLTSVCGMMPLVLFPGQGSEIYRGLGSVVVGGLLVSTLFTLLVVPALFSLVLDAKAAVSRRTARLMGEAEPEMTPGD
ncbi:MAG: efflux RND transporter permease subunit [Bryobacterales bacterium]|nr:efflux RND transporter permease subunit [Bryobacterales bacterium]